jgi:hypothetical protein
VAESGLEGTSLAAVDLMAEDGGAGDSAGALVEERLAVGTGTVIDDDDGDVREDAQLAAVGRKLLIGVERWDDDGDHRPERGRAGYAVVAGWIP